MYPFLYVPRSLDVHHEVRTTNMPQGCTKVLLLTIGSPVETLCPFIYSGRVAKVLGLPLPIIKIHSIRQIAFELAIADVIISNSPKNYPYLTDPLW